MPLPNTPKPGHHSPTDTLSRPDRYPHTTPLPKPPQNGPQRVTRKWDSAPQSVILNDYLTYLDDIRKVVDHIPPGYEHTETEFTTQPETNALRAILTFTRKTN